MYRTFHRYYWFYCTMHPSSQPRTPSSPCLSRSSFFPAGLFRVPTVPPTPRTSLPPSLPELEYALATIFRPLPSPPRVPHASLWLLPAVLRPPTDTPSRSLVVRQYSALLFRSFACRLRPRYHFRLPSHQPQVKYFVCCRTPAQLELLGLPSPFVHYVSHHTTVVQTSNPQCLLRSTTAACRSLSTVPGTTYYLFPLLTQPSQQHTATRAGFCSGQFQ